MSNNASSNAIKREKAPIEADLFSFHLGVTLGICWSRNSLMFCSLLRVCLSLHNRWSLEIWVSVELS